MAKRKRKRAGRPPGSKNKVKTVSSPVAKNRGRKPGRKSGSVLQQQIENLQTERDNLMANITRLEKAIVLLKELDIQ